MQYPTRLHPAALLPAGPRIALKQRRIQRFCIEERCAGPPPGAVLRLFGSIAAARHLFHLSILPIAMKKHELITPCANVPEKTQDDVPTPCKHKPMEGARSRKPTADWQGLALAVLAVLFFQL
ncbi:hypothetical protein [Hymenobacter ruber]